MKKEQTISPEAPGKPSEKSAGFFASLYDALNSIRLTVFLFIILGVVSIVGTIIEQGATPEKYAQSYSEGTIRLFNALGLFDMYHTPWFFGLLLLLMLNLIVCTIERLPRVWRFAKGIKPVLDEGDEKKHPFMETLQVDGATEKVEQAFRKSARFSIWIMLLDVTAVALAVFFTMIYDLNFLEFVSFIIIPLGYVALLNFPGKLIRTEREDTVHFFLNQWLVSRFGVYITHVSILTIFAGAIVGNLFGFKGYIAIPEGRTDNQMFVRQNKMIDTVSASMRGLFSGKKDAPADPHANRDSEYKTLPFAIRCDDFSISYYPNTGRPKDYTSDLVVLRDGQEETRKTIEVNDPLVVDDIYFYQSNYGQTGRPGLVVFEVTAPNGDTREYRTPPNGKFRIEGTATDVEVVSFVPDFTIVRGRVTSRSNELINPAVYLRATDGGKSLFTGWLLPKFPEHSVETGPYKFAFKDYWGWQYTGLQVAYDPGVEVVWIGCSLLVVGLMISFFHSHQRLWARVKGDHVVLSGSTHKNRMAFEKKFNDLVQLLKE